jgi:hypothetical protein
MRSQLPANASVLVTGNAALQEWSPALLQREVLTTPFGLEWQPQELKSVNAINKALDQNDLATAVQAAQRYSGHRQFYLIAPPRQLASLLAGAPSSISITPIVSAPPLTLSLVEIK